MGNTIKAEATRDPEGPGKDVAFFQAMNIRWLNVFITKIKDAKKSEFNIANVNETLKWSDYFRIFIEIKESMILEIHTKERATWHSATAGYAMTKRSDDDESTVTNDVVVGRDPKLPTDDYTDDDPSEVGQDEFEMDDDLNGDSRPTSSNQPHHRASVISQNHNTTTNGNNITNKNVSRNWNPHFTSPIFFGYTTETVADFDKILATEKQELKNREHRAIERARATRSVAIDALERNTTAQATLRLEKINKLSEKYEAIKAKREVELQRSERELLHSAYAIYEVT